MNNFNDPPHKKWCRYLKAARNFLDSYGSSTNEWFIVSLFREYYFTTAALSLIVAFLLVLMKDSAERGHGGSKHGYSWLDVNTVMDGEHQRALNADDDHIFQQHQDNANHYSNHHIDYHRNKTNYSSINAAAPTYEYIRCGGDGNKDDIGLNDREQRRLLALDKPTADLRLSSPEHLAIPVSYFCVGFLGR